MNYSMADAGDSRRRFADAIRIEAMDGGFIRAEDERRLLQDGMSRYNLSLEEARGVLLSTVNDQGYTLQRTTEAEISELLTMQAAKGRRRRLSRAQFEQAAEMYRMKARGRVPMEEARQRVKVLMQEHDIEPKRAGWVIRSKRWYNSIKT